ncbi:Metal transporter cnnm2, variant 2 [Perkinsus olseni]|uniref:Metal transporter cnnm2, variant 2 n=1 Tax=Perkinsus olseni TaxID=32597 RepID=A0A7J6LAM6_PEROL|nr:Metal transporter cnnm2, variant 2 [Perkinsus olseni]
MTVPSPNPTKTANSESRRRFRVLRSSCKEVDPGWKQLVGQSSFEAFELGGSGLIPGRRLKAVLEREAMINDERSMAIYQVSGGYDRYGQPRKAFECRASDIWLSRRPEFIGKVAAGSVGMLPVLPLVGMLGQRPLYVMSCPSLIFMLDGSSPGIEVLRWVLIVLLVMCSAMFSGLTLGFLSLDKVGLEIVKAGANTKQAKYAKRIIPIRKDGNLLLCTLLLGNVAVNSLLSIILADITGGLLGFILSTAIILLFGEIFPQALCSRYSLKIGGIAVPVVRVCIVLLYPIAKPIALTLDCILGRDVGTIHSRSELLQLLAIHVEEKALDDETGKVMQGALKTLHEMKIMTPVEDVFMLPIEAVLDYKTVTQIFQCGFSRIPVYRGTMNNIVGVLFTKDLILVDPDDATPLSAFLQIFARCMEVLEESQSVSSAFRRFRSGGSHMGLVRKVAPGDSGRSSKPSLKGSPVVGKYDSIGTNITQSTRAASLNGRDDPDIELVGVLTLEDIVEEIIQEEIIDETDVYVDVDNRVEVPGDRCVLNEQRLRLLNAQLLEEPLTADEIRALSLHLLHNQPALSEDLDQKSVEWLLENAEVRTYDNQHRSKVRLADTSAAIRTESMLPENDTLGQSSGGNSPRSFEEDDLWIYRRGVETDVCCIVLTGRLAVLAGHDKFRSEAGAFSVLAVEALLHDGYAPDFSARVGSEKVRCIKISRPVYDEAVEYKRTGVVSLSIPTLRQLTEKIGEGVSLRALSARSSRALARGSYAQQLRQQQRIILSQHFVQKRSSDRSLNAVSQLRRCSSADDVGRQGGNNVEGEEPAVADSRSMDGL